MSATTTALEVLCNTCSDEQLRAYNLSQVLRLAAQSEDLDEVRAAASMGAEIADIISLKLDEASTAARSPLLDAAVTAAA